MTNEPTQMDWILHDTRHHTPTEKWNKRDSLEHYFSAHSDERLIYYAPILRAEVKRLRKEINQLPIDLHESLDMILEAHYPEIRESVMAMFGDAWGNNLTGYAE